MKYDPKNDKPHGDRDNPFTPTKDDPMCECGWPKHHHMGQVAGMPIAHDRGVPFSDDCSGFRAAKDGSNASLAQLVDGVK